MLRFFQQSPTGLQASDDFSRLGSMVWIDLLSPSEAEIAMVLKLGVDVPSLAEMEEIEISNRLYHEGKDDYLTVVLPGQTPEPNGEGVMQIMGPVCLILGPNRLVTVRHHSPRPFETFPERAAKTVAGCGSVDAIFLGLVEEIIGRLADLLEISGRSLDELTGKIYRENGHLIKADEHHKSLTRLGNIGEVIGRVRLALLTIGRALSYVDASISRRNEQALLSEVASAQKHDIAALEVHADFLSARLGLASDATLGMINLAQNVTVRIVSVVAALFLPPTLIASIYGMNFQVMPELQNPYGYPFALFLMLASAVLTWAFCKWRGWL